MPERSQEGANRRSRLRTLFRMSLPRPFWAAALLLNPLAGVAAAASLPAASIPAASIPAASIPAASIKELPVQEISALAEQGAESLSLLLLAEAEPDLAQAPEAWTRWHRSKIELLRQKEAWQAIIREYENLPLAVPAAHRDWLFTQVIKTYLTMGSGEQARDLLLALIWDSEHDEGELAQWRRLVVQSYLVEGRYEDARSAVLRYEQDYPAAAQEPRWLGLKARLLIANERANEAAILAVGSTAAPARSAYVLARLNGGAPLEPDLVDQAFGWLDAPGLDVSFKQALFNGLFQRSRQLDDWPRRIGLLQRLLEVTHLEVAQVTAVVDALWFSLVQYGRQLANRHQLLVGNFTPWFELAQQLEAGEDWQAEALYAWLAIEAQGADIKARAHRGLVERLSHRGENDLLRSLYLSSAQFTDVSVLPLAVMYRLVDMALAEHDLGLAAKLMSELDAPAGVDVVEWQLRRARVQILAGNPARGGARLKEIAAADSLTDSQLDNLVLAVQDLQHQGAPELGTEILQTLLPKLPDSRRRGELYFWLGELRWSQGRYSDAARHYLHAARLSAQAESDWAEAARGRAAEALVRAGLISDAVQLYRRLLDGAAPAQRAIYGARIRGLEAGRARSDD